ncbi:MAG: glycosyltransferase family 4 protein [Gemmatimonadaceae bacterium]
MTSHVPGAAAAPNLIVDARALHGSGIGRVMRELIPRLHASAAFRSTLLVGDPREIEPWARAAVPGAVTLPLRAARYDWRTEVGWRRLSRRFPAPAVHWFPHWDAPLAGTTAQAVVSVNDLIPLDVPGAAPAWKRAAMAWWLDRAVRRAGAVHVPSEATAAALVRRFPGARPMVIRYGASMLAGMPLASDAAPPPGVPYLLVVANRKPHKGLDVALRAFASLRGEWPELRLAIAGERFAHWSALRALAELLGISQALLDLPPLSDAGLSRWYQGAFAVLLPSRAEGFGLPVLEAMALGAPVISTRAGSLPEVAGDAALLVDAGDAPALAEAVRRLRAAPALRAQLVQRGISHAATFRWDDTANAMTRLLLSLPRPA